MDMTEKLDENRYRCVLEGPRSPVFNLFWESFKEDRSLTFARVLHASFQTVWRIPGAAMCRPGPGRERYIFETLRRWARRVCDLCRVELEVTGREKLEPDQTYLVVANHSSPMDIPVLYSALPLLAGFVANALFLKIPVFSHWMKMSGAVFVDQGRPDQEFSSFREMVGTLRKGRSLILFPEGGIHQGDGLGVFRRGGVHTAVFANVPIIPVCLKGTGDVLRAGSFAIHKGRNVRIDFGDPVDPARLNRFERKNIEFLVYNRLLGMKT